MKQTYRQLADKILEMDRLAQEIRELGRDLPVIQRNTTALSSLIRVLKFGVVDTAEALENQDQNKDQTKA